MKNNVDVYPLFSDIEDEALRNRNRGVIMANIMEDHTYKGKFPPSGLSLLLSYFKNIPSKERRGAYEEFFKHTGIRGFQ